MRRLRRVLCLLNIYVWLRKTFKYGKIVLPCEPKYRPRDKSFFQGRFAADSIFVQGIPWTRISRMGELC
jgi:hypothetical protein